MATTITKRVNIGTHGADYDAWRDSWGDSWGEHWRVFLPLSSLGLTPRVSAAAAVNITKRVTL